MAKISLNKIIDVLTENWSKDNRNGMPYSGKSVREALQAKLAEHENQKVGYFAWSSSIDSSNYYHLWGFKSKADYEAYKAGDKEDDAIKKLLLVDEALPISTVQGDSYGAYLFSTISTTNNIVVAEKSLLVPLRFHAVRNSNGDRLNVGAKGTLVVQRKLGASSWTTVATLEDALESTDYSNTNDYKSVDIGAYLSDGAQQIRLQARYSYADGEGNQQSQSSTYVVIGASVTLANLTLSCRQDWHTPIAASTQQANGFPYAYLVNGAVQKTLHVEIVGGNGKVLSINRDSAISENGVTVRNTYKDPTNTYNLFKHGVRLVRAWLTCDDGLGGTLKSDVLENRFMVVNTSESGVDKKKPYLMIQNLVNKTVNFNVVKLCDYAVYSPKANADGSITNDGGNVTTIFYLTSYADNFPAGNVTEYFRIEQDVQPGVQSALSTTIEIESDEDAANLVAYFRAYRRDGDNEVDFLTDSIGANNVSIDVDNSDSYAPTAGATFLLNPKVRNNTESDPRKIYNAKANNAEVESSWRNFGFVSDGWVTAEDGIKVLRVPAGSSVNFKFNPFAQFFTTPDSSMTLEFDMKISNVTDTSKPIVQICEQVAANFLGLRVLPLTGYIYSASDNTESEIDVPLQEGVRFHFALNIHNSVITNKDDALVPSSDSLNTSATSIPLVRIFINGDIRREVRFSTTNREEFCTGLMSNGGVTIGQEAADIDIYSIRCYQNMQLESKDIIKDYISTFSTTEEKNAARRRNDILTGEKVDCEKVKALGKRTLIMHGNEPYFYNSGSQKVWWEIFQYDEDAKLIPELSGTICKETKTKSKRQGSTANTYFYSNIQTKIDDAGSIVVPLDKLGKNLTWVLNDPVQDESGETRRYVAIYGGNLGKYDPVKNEPNLYEYSEVAGVPSVTVPDGWIDGNGMYRGKGFMITEGTPYATKLVLKINYASSMQSHLTGGCRMFNDLHDICVGRNPLQEACPTARVSKYTEPVFFFTQKDDDSKPVFRGGGNFGAGKMDKPTWGYVKKLYPNFAMFEGSDNNYELTDMRVPFITDSSCPEAVTYSPDDEGYFYNGLQNIDFDAGATDNKEDGEHPKAVLTDRIAEVFNFLYLHAPRIKYYVGSFTDFLLSDDARNTQFKYWCTQGDDAYLLKRYNYVTKNWVDAGMWRNGKYEKIDLRTDEMTKDAYEASENKAQYAKLNKELIAAVVAHAKKYIGWYINEKSLRFHYALINHFIAGTDNCSKNTYYVFTSPVNVTIDGVTKSVCQMELHQDDVDTILATDNNGRFTKKYYVDRMHPYAEGDSSTSQYEGMNNVLFNLCEEMYESTRELQSMLKSILSAMCRLVSESDKMEGFDGNSKVSAWGFLWKYLFSVNTYFPEVAYCEQARIRYEYPAQLGFVSSGSGARGVAPITQSCGSALQGELQYMRQRLVYMASYAAWGNLFDGGKSENIGISDVTDTFAMQAFHLPDSATSATEYKFKVKPSQYLYPTGMMGQTSVDPHTRVAPDEEFELNLGTTSSNDTGLSVLGINYYHSIGNIGDLSTSPNLSVTVNGKRLTEVVAEPSKLYTDMGSGRRMPAFRPNNIVISANNVRRVSLNGCSGIGGTLNLGNLNRLETIDFRSTDIYGLQLPASKALSRICMPDKMTNIQLRNLPSLVDASVDGASQLTKLDIDCATVNFDVETLLTEIYDYKRADQNSVALTSAIVNKAKFTDFPIDAFRYFDSVQDSSITGSIKIADSSENTFSFAEVCNLIERYGNIQSQNNVLYLNYRKKTISSFSVSGEKYISKMGLFDNFTIKVSPPSGNNIAVSKNRPAVNFAFSGSNASQAKQYADIVDTVKGTLNIKKLSDPAAKQRFTIKVDMTTLSGDTLAENIPIGFYRRLPKLGDFAYADGTFDDYLDSSKTCVGVVFDVKKVNNAQGQCLVWASDYLNFVSSDAVINTKGPMWGLLNYTNNSVSVGDSVLKEIATAIGVEGDVTDLAALVNYTFVGLNKDKGDGTVVNDNYITPETYHNNDAVGGYREIGIGGSVTDWNGKENTDKIVALAKLILTNYLDYPLPKTFEELCNQMAALYNQKKGEGVTYPNVWTQLFYPPAYGCVLYEPKVKDGEKLNVQYKRGRWYLPAMGELSRVYNFFGNSKGFVNNASASIDYANENPITEAKTPIFSNLLARANNVGRLCPVAMMSSSAGHWSSTEYNGGNAWLVNSGNGNTGVNLKYYSWQVRAAVAFTFDL